MLQVQHCDYADGRGRFDRDSGRGCRGGSYNTGMRRLLPACFVSFVLVACMSVGTPVLHGVVTALYSNGMGVEGILAGGTDEIVRERVAFTQDTRLYVAPLGREGSLSLLRVGQTVEVWTDHETMDSYPPQIIASSVLIVRESP
jgi:hypothetical protein